MPRHAPSPIPSGFGLLIDSAGRFWPVELVYSGDDGPPYEQIVRAVPLTTRGKLRRVDAAAVLYKAAALSPQERKSQDFQ